MYGDSSKSGVLASASSRSRRWFSVLVWVAAACAEGTPSSPSAGLHVIGGQDQEGEAGAALGAAVVVRVASALTAPLEGVRIEATTPAGGSVVPTNTTTNAAGQASFAWTLATATGPQALVIENMNTHERVTISATATPPKVATVTVTPSAAEIVRAYTQTLTATLRDARGTELTGHAITWSSSDPAIASVNATTGVVTAFAEGKVGITATSEGKSGTAQLTVVHAVPTQLALSMQPGGAIKDLPLATQPVVEVRDVNAMVVQGLGAPVTVALASGSGMLGGTLTVAAVDGVARFTDLSITGTGGPHTLTFSSPGLPSVTSGTFFVGAVAVTTNTLPNGTRAVAYPSQTLVAAGGTDPYVWSLAGGALPPGLSLSGTGVIAGTPTLVGKYDFTAQAVSGTVVGTAPLSITINDPPLTIATTTLPAGGKDIAYAAYQLVASGGAGTYSWSVFSGALPAGITLTPAGLISGTPTAVGTAQFVARVTSGSQSQTQSFVLDIAQWEPLVLTLEPDPVTYTSMTMRGSVDPQGLPVVEYWFEWTTVTNYPMCSYVPATPHRQLTGGSAAIVTAPLSHLYQAGAPVEQRIVSQRPGGPVQRGQCIRRTTTPPTLAPIGPVQFAAPSNGALPGSQVFPLIATPKYWILPAFMNQVTYSTNVTPWLKFSLPSVGSGSTQTGAVTIQPSRTDLTPGVYQATVKFLLCYGANCDYAIPVEIGVTYTVS